MKLVERLPLFKRFQRRPEFGTSRGDNLTTKGDMEVALEGGRLILDGWSATFDGRDIDGFRVTCGGRELTEIQVELKRPSPAVSQHYPWLPQHARCGFIIRAELDEEQYARARSSLITCSPLVGREIGQIMTRVIEPRMPIPNPEDFIVDVVGGYHDVASEYLGYLIRAADLTPNCDVLEVGCGVGRIAQMVAHYLAPSARYEGFDIVDKFIDWCGRTITAHAPNFRFRKVDLHNKFYNPGGTLQSSDFRFPYDDESFDVVYLTSVFTHMMAPDVRHYIDEFQRVLRPGGRCVSTCFMLNPETEALIAQGKSAQPLSHQFGETYATDPNVPEAVSGFQESQLLQWYKERGFVLRGKYYGAWSGRTPFTSAQDILVHQKS